MDITSELKEPLVLIVDDEQVMRQYLHIAMRHAGYRVAEALDGDECLSAYCQLHPDIVLLDALMPVMDGFTCCEKIQALPEPYHAPVLMITGLEDNESVDRAFAVGATDYVNKPIRIPVLVQRVKRLIQQSRLQQQLEASNQTLENRVQERTSELETAITQLQFEMDKRMQAEAEVIRALLQEKELSELKSKLISTLSHEFRTPLSLISLSTDILEQQYNSLDQEKRSRRFSQIRGNINRITEVLDDALAISKNDSGELKFDPLQINLKAFCQTLVLELQQKLGGKHQITFHYDCDCPEIVYLDPNLLQQILSHLLANATRYSPKGGEVSLELRREGSSIIFRVRDCGIGIPQAELSSIFDKFYRAGNADSIPGTPGAGLGLTIVKQAADLHGATIDVESDIAQGTTFSLTFPLVHTSPLAQIVSKSDA